MYKLIVILMIVLLLPACATTQLPTTHDMTEFKIKVIEDDKIGYNVAGDKIMGLATWDLLTSTCIIRVPSITDIREYKLLIHWGHELLHCVKGHFHARRKFLIREKFKFTGE